MTFQSLAVTICTTSLGIQKFYILPTEYLHHLYMSNEKNIEVFPHTTLNDRLLQSRRQVFTARYDLGLYMDHGLSLNGYIKTLLKRVYFVGSYHIRTFIT